MEMMKNTTKSQAALKDMIDSFLELKLQSVELADDDPFGKAVVVLSNWYRKSIRVLRER